MSEKPMETAFDDLDAGTCNVCGGPVRYGSRHVRCGEAVMRLERERDALREALREYHESHTAPYPTYKDGVEAQNAWIERINKSEELVVHILGKETSHPPVNKA